MRKLKQNKYWFILFSLLLTGCFGNKGGIDSLQQVQDLSPSSISKDSKGMTPIRLLAVQETAMSTGAQGGLAWRSKQINADLQAQAGVLDQAFNFNQMMLPHNVLPPVLTQGDNTLNLADNNTIRIADRTYKIEAQAKFVTVPPTWRDYLWLSYKKPDVPPASLLPQNAKEKEIWQQYSALGWKNGIYQADSIYSANLSRLKRDFMGMVRYRVLLAQNMVTPPYVSSADLGVTGGGSDLTINDRVLRITALPSLQANPKRWNPVLQNDN
jgi:defect in organelle trafficking protein DotC